MLTENTICRPTLLPSSFFIPPSPLLLPSLPGRIESHPRRGKTTKTFLYVATVRDYVYKRVSFLLPAPFPQSSCSTNHFDSSCTLHHCCLYPMHPFLPDRPISFSSMPAAERMGSTAAIGSRSINFVLYVMIYAYNVYNLYSHNTMHNMWENK